MNTERKTGMKTEWVFSLPDGGRWSWHAETETEARVEMALLGVVVGDLLEKRETT